MALDGGFYIFGEVGIHDRCRVLGQERNALGDGAARRSGRMDHATGNLPLSMTTSAPARTRARTSRSCWRLPLPRCGSHGQPWRDYTALVDTPPTEARGSIARRKTPGPAKLRITLSLQRTARMLSGRFRHFRHSLKDFLESSSLEGQQTPRVWFLYGYLLLRLGEKINTRRAVRSSKSNRLEPNLESTWRPESLIPSPSRLATVGFL